ncbi:hypothetical protein HPP92_016804 [Vanilla planifolia]|uniref:Uncharacterized protein n=1 Tax=Vanilla planifolia TaxID=51239 RepID=A0A835QIT4_VANPL|nr:hypothetical protein HPP92_016804 [Vanilla planifolia]
MAVYNGRQLGMSSMLVPRRHGHLRWWHRFGKATSLFLFKKRCQATPIPRTSPGKFAAKGGRCHCSKRR